jgi:hypothetical protein
MKKLFLRLISFFDARDVFVFIGFALLFTGLTYTYDVFIAMVVLGAIIIIKGLTKWV